MLDRISQRVQESIEVKQSLLADSQQLQIIGQLAEACAQCFRAKGKVLFCGNGGSAADAQHLAAELSGRFYYDRDPLFAEAMHVNTSFITAVGNDYGYDQVFQRQVRGWGQRGDVLIGLSTSGNSENVIRAIEQANELNMITAGLTGFGGGKMKTICNYLITVASTDTARIQESHIMIGHIICELIESELFPRQDG